MELSSGLAKLQAEVMCPVCLDYLKDPVTLDCGHNFCGACIENSWKEVEGTFPCPLCRQPRLTRSVSANPQLARLVELAQLLQGSRPLAGEEAQAEARSCAEHQQELSLFCEDHQELLCPRCAQSAAHQGHRVATVQEAARRHRQRLGGYIGPLKKRLAQVQKMTVAQDRTLRQLREDVDRQKRRLASEFEQLAEFVERQQDAALGRLAEEDKRLQRQLSANIAAYSDHIARLKGLMKEVAERSVLSEEMLLAGLGGVVRRCEDLQPPAVAPLSCRRPDYSLPPLCSALSNLIRRFLEPVSLDPRTAHPSLRVSEDGKSVSWVPKRLRSQTSAKFGGSSAELVVLGREGFSCGRHYWEVQVGDKPEWAVGVCTDAPCSQAQGFPPGRKGLWVLQLQDGVYLGAGPAGAPLAVKDRPKVIGIFLDYELGQLCFYNASDRSYLHSFSETFAEVLKPYFRVGPDCTPLTLSTGSGDLD
ncbi:tripartite motif-containing protein 75-like [Suncus etruscus]|uniref:tripartite motif-containing protein 75-like n=1 Tax=Suncus etruscus TaxID=109475 RepID=UPI002110E5E1|nr:tripartite motif-containing protein 75-like [Suncus etruscus]